MFTVWLNVKRKSQTNADHVYDFVDAPSWTGLRRKVEAEFAKGLYWNIHRVERSTPLTWCVLDIRTPRKFPLKTPEELRRAGADENSIYRASARRRGRSPRPTRRPI